MKKVLLIPDSFKGTMSSAEICTIMRQNVLQYYPTAQVVEIPVADGGEGSVDAFLAAVGGKKISLVVKGPFMQDMDSFYALLPDGTAVVEMAACAGLPLVGDTLTPDKTTTYGVGQLILHAVNQGCKKLVVALGGSATNDLGAGAAAALGVRFINGAGQAFVPTGGTLAQIKQIDMSGLTPALKNVDIVTMCDIDNPLYGETGAAAIFGPQKGASPAMVALLDDGLRSAADVIQQQLGCDIAHLPGAGAAGGMGGGMVAFLGSRLQMGIQTVLDTVGFDDLLQDADMIFTGEGKLDTQSLRGKVVVGVARRAKPKQVPVIAVVGDIGDGIEQVYQEGVSAVFSINRVAVDFAAAKLRSPKDLALTMDNLMRFCQTMGL
ncbi:glycerate kinase [Ruminococcaceae bacterium OttesenSCG-928-A16]|nr:glycerate kinase [Ruminococcaceae bacterium OttesenSCG-928-A16]